MCYGTCLACFSVDNLIVQHSIGCTLCCERYEMLGHDVSGSWLWLWQWMLCIHALGSHNVWYKLSWNLNCLMPSTLNLCSLALHDWSFLLLIDNWKSSDFVYFLCFSGTLCYCVKTVIVSVNALVSFLFLFLFRAWGFPRRLELAYVV